MGKRLLSTAILVAVVCLFAAPPACAKTLVVKRDPTGKLEVTDPNENLVTRVVALPFRIVTMFFKASSVKPQGFGRPITQNQMEADVSVTQKTVDTAKKVPVNVDKTVDMVTKRAVRTTKRVLDPWGKIEQSR
jgi:hypothetical protein